MLINSKVNYNYFTENKLRVFLCDPCSKAAREDKRIQRTTTLKVSIPARTKPHLSVRLPQSPLSLFSPSEHSHWHLEESQVVGTAWLALQQSQHWPASHPVLLNPYFWSLGFATMKKGFKTMQCTRAYTPRKPDLKETRAPQCSSQHCLS